MCFMGCVNNILWTCDIFYWIASQLSIVCRQNRVFLLCWMTMPAYIHACRCTCMHAWCRPSYSSKWRPSRMFEKISKLHLLFQLPITSRDRWVMLQYPPTPRAPTWQNVYYGVRPIGLMAASPTFRRQVFARLHITASVSSQSIAILNLATGAFAKVTSVSFASQPNSSPFATGHLYTI